MADWQQITVVVAAVVQLDSIVGRICRVSLSGLFRSEYFVFTESRSTIIGGILSALGLSVSVQALLGLGLKESSREEGKLRISGFYRYTRNHKLSG